MSDERASDAIQSAYRDTVDAASQGAQAAKDAVVAGSDILQDFVEDHPYTTVALAFGLGLLIGFSTSREPARRGWWD